MAVVGGLVCVLITPPFALAYVDAYGSGTGETAPAWTESLDWMGFLAGSDVAVYDAYGVIFGCALAVVVVGVAVIVARRTGKGDWEGPGWRAVIVGLGAVAVGSLMEYGISEETFDASWGFGLELLGFTILIIALPILGYAARTENGVGRAKALAVGASGLLGVALGTALIGHLPSGPAAPFIIAAMVLGVMGLEPRQTSDV